jgi:hypothetical protein
MPALCLLASELLFDLLWPPIGVVSERRTYFRQQGIGTPSACATPKQICAGDVVLLAVKPLLALAVARVRDSDRVSECHKKGISQPAAAQQTQGSDNFSSSHEAALFTTSILLFFARGSIVASKRVCWR